MIFFSMVFFASFKSGYGPPDLAIIGRIQPGAVGVSIVRNPDWLIVVRGKITKEILLFAHDKMWSIFKVIVDYNATMESTIFKIILKNVEKYLKSIILQNVIVMDS